MGYNLSKHSVVRNLPQLEKLRSAKATLKIPAAKPRSLARKLREAIKAAGVHDEYKALHDDLAGNYIFHEERYAVIAEFVGVGEPEIVREENPFQSQASSSETPPPAPKRPENKVVPEAESLLDIISTVMSRFPDEEELVFPNAPLSHEDAEKLWRFTQKPGILWKYIDRDENGVVLTKKEVPEEVLWKPSR